MFPVFIKTIPSVLALMLLMTLNGGAFPRFHPRGCYKTAAGWAALVPLVFWVLYAIICAFIDPSGNNPLDDFEENESLAIVVQKAMFCGFYIYMFYDWIMYRRFKARKVTEKITEPVYGLDVVKHGGFFERNVYGIVQVGSKVVGTRERTSIGLRDAFFQILITGALAAWCVMAIH